MLACHLDRLYSLHHYAELFLGEITVFQGLNSNQIKTNISDNGNTLTISVRGNFDFSMVKLFREAYVRVDPLPEKVIVDLRNTNTIDSAALGMLINMKKNLGKPDRDISIQNCNPTVKRILSIARFDILFSID